MAEGIEKNIERLKKSKQYRGNTLLYSLAGVDNPSLYKLSNDNLKNKKDKKGRRDDGGIYIDWSKRQPMQRRNIDLLSVSKALPSEEVAYNFGNALEFDGVDDFCDLPAVTGSSLTISLWVNFNSIASTEAIIGGSSGIDWLRYQTNPRLQVRTSGGINNNYNLSSPLSTGTWYHIFYTDNGTVGRIFVNGVESSTGALATSGTYNYNYIGTQSVFFLNGVLDDLLVWSGVAGTAQNAVDLYNGGDGVDPTTVIASPNRWYKFNDNPNDSGTDGQNLTLNNFVADPYVAHI